jgi:hypothetical protein
MKETSRPSEATKARERELRHRFGYDIKIYEGEDITEARLRDLSLRLVPCLAQAFFAETPEERDIMESKYKEVVSQIGQRFPVK